MAVLIIVAILHRKKSKSAQYRFLFERRAELRARLKLNKFPSRTTYFERYRRAHRLLEPAIRVQGQQILLDGLADATTLAVDKSLIAARGPLWHKKDRRAGRLPMPGIDRDSTWAFSQHDGWVQGYSYEVVTTATEGSTVVPLLGSAHTASCKEFTSFPPKLEQLPEQTQHLLADSGYDSLPIGERIELRDDGRPTGRRFICPPNIRNSKGKASNPRRAERIRFYSSPAGRELYARRSQTVEPFNDWFKTLFELNHTVWHRGLDNNRTQLLAAIFSHQLLVRYHHRCGGRNGEVKWILDQL